MSDLAGGETPFARAFNEMVDRLVTLMESKAPAPAEKEEGGQEKMETSPDTITFAVPMADGKLAAHFGHCERFALVKTEGGAIKHTSTVTPPPHEPGVLPAWLHEQGADIIIAGGMGSRAQQLFQENGIKVVVGAPADAPEVLVNQYLSGTLVSGDNLCDH
jgi:predicted Fe-Mo cluster-binding NifX family protein